jgi:hypothetical protein
MALELKKEERIAGATTGSGKWPGNVTRCPIGKAPAALCWRSTSTLAMAGHYFLLGNDATCARALWRQGGFALADEVIE